LVYKTDVPAAGDKVDGIEFPEAQDAINTYPIATLKESKNPPIAKAFVDYVLSPEGQAVLDKPGLRSPDSEPAAAEPNPVTESATGTKGERLWQSRLPLLLAAPAALALLFLVLLLVGLVMRAPWADAGAVLTSAGALQALRLSMITATVSVIIVVLIGVPLA
jgi:ABC-type glycerol-3-phosphate transport system substrate-binding protein